MLKWMKRKTQLAIVNAATSDIERFCLGLDGGSSDEVARIVGMATLLRIRLESAGRLPRYVLDLRLQRDQYQANLVQIYLNRLVNEFQKMSQPSDAAAAMVWLHSARSLNIPEVRSLGREMWSGLLRGFNGAADAATDVCHLVGCEVPIDIEAEVRFVPGGLEPAQYAREDAQRSFSEQPLLSPSVAARD